MSVYLWINAALYLLFAAWITLSPWRTAANLGYVGLDASGRSEYLVVYGGMELGLAAIFALLARGTPEMQRVGVLVALCLYVPIVAYRLVTVLRFWPVQGTTLVVAALEVLLLATAVALAWRSGAALPPR